MTLPYCGGSAIPDLWPALGPQLAATPSLLPDEGPSSLRLRTCVTSSEKPPPVLLTTQTLFPSHLLNTSHPPPYRNDLRVAWLFLPVTFSSHLIPYSFSRSLLSICPLRGIVPTVEGTEIIRDPQECNSFLGEDGNQRHNQRNLRVSNSN